MSSSTTTTPTEITPTLLASFEQPREPSISPDGKSIVYARRNFWARKENHEHIVASLWLAEVGVENSGRQLTTGHNCNDNSPRFSPDGNWISFKSDRAKQGKASAIYLLPVNKVGEALPVTPAENEAGVGEYRWSPDSKSIAFAAADEKSEEKKKKEEGKDDPNVFGDWQFARLKVVDVETKEVRTLFSEEAHVASCTWSPDGKKIAFTVMRTPELNEIAEGSKVKVVDVKSGNVEGIAEIGPGSDLIWFNDGLFYLGVNDGIQTGNIVWSIAPKAGAKPERMDYGVDSCAAGIKLCGDEIVAYVLEGLNDTFRIPKGEKLLSMEGKVAKNSWDALVKDGKKTVAYIKGAANGSLDVYCSVDGKETRLSTHGKHFEDINVGSSTSIKTTAPDGVVCDGVLLTPTSLKDKKGPHPAIVCVHGGPYSRVTEGDEPFFNWPQWLLACGYVVLCPNYRGGTGHGKKYAEAVIGKPHASYDDVIVLTKKCIKDGIIDEKRCAIGGWSQGGFMTFYAVTQDSTFHFTAAIAGAGVSDWDTMSMTSDLPAFESTLAGYNPWSATDRTSAREGSAIYQMRNVTTPCLILHGEKDERVPVEQAIGFSRGLRAQGKEFEMAIYPREGHGYPMPFEFKHYVDKLERVKTFLAKHLNK